MLKKFNIVATMLLMSDMITKKLFFFAICVGIVCSLILAPSTLGTHMSLHNAVVAQNIDDNNGEALTIEFLDFVNCSKQRVQHRSYHFFLATMRQPH